MLLRPKNKDADPKERALWGELMSLGMVFPIAIALGFFGGRWIGGWFGHPLLGQWIGLVYGIATGFYELYKTTKRLDRLDQQPPPEGPQDPEDPKC
jgi:uncharacterized protein YneF (UPF0154 family)